MNYSNERRRNRVAALGAGGTDSPQWTCGPLMTGTFFKTRIMGLGPAQQFRQ